MKGDVSSEHSETLPTTADSISVAQASSEEKDSNKLPDGSLFHPHAPLWIFFFERGGKKLTGLLSWLDIWHSGLLSRAISPYVRGDKPFPDLFLFFPIETPAPNGILLIFHHPGKAAECLGFLPDTLLGLSIKHVVIDRTSLSEEIRQQIPSLALLSTPDQIITVRLSDQTDDPFTWVSR